MRHVQPAVVYHQDLRRNLPEHRQGQDLNSTDRDAAAALSATVLPFWLKPVQSGGIAAHKPLQFVDILCKEMGLIGPRSASWGAVSYRLLANQAIGRAAWSYRPVAALRSWWAGF